MDNSGTTIKMCEKAEEIQSLRSAVFESQTRDSSDYESNFEKFLGDWFWCIGEGGKAGIEILKYDNDEDRYMLGGYGDKWRKIIWLPRQDQLQEMIEKHLWQLNFDFIRWLCDEPYDGHIRHKHLDYTSMEQLWLAFVMRECYNKVWSTEKEEWVSQSRSFAPNVKKKEL